MTYKFRNQEQLHFVTFRSKNIMRDMKKHTSLALKQAIKQHPQESRREWLLWMVKDLEERMARILIGSVK